MLLATFLLAAVFLLAWGGIHVMLPLLWRVFFRLGRGLARLAFGPQRLARWSEHGILGLRPPRHPYRRVVLIGLCGFLAAAVVGAGFLALGEEVRESSASLQRMDHHVWELARSHRSPGRTLFFTAFTLLGTPVGLGAVVALATGALYTRGFRRLPLFVIVSTSRPRARSFSAIMACGVGKPGRVPDVWSLPRRRIESAGSMPSASYCANSFCQASMRWLSGMERSQGG